MWQYATIMPTADRSATKKHKKRSCPKETPSEYIHFVKMNSNLQAKLEEFHSVAF